ncbi:hypothetical protein Syun_028553 [Stephania yunnanensis]|uniref:Cation/H+ exchanger domain-containing protein n=1 Tax=Stephania yunnanensis TaxID=152371 RepID=A0AAP0HGK0_9MAGN
MKATSNGSFQGENPLDYALPLAILQICLVVVLTRTLAFMLKPLRQPRVIAEIIGGILLGPSALGRSDKFLHTVFPARSMTVLDTLANIGLLFFLFLVGLELDIRAILRTGKKSLFVAAAGISLPFVLGIGTSVVLRNTISKGVQGGSFLVFMGVSLSITAFPVLARILAELKLLTTDLGRTAMSAAAVNDVAAWILLALAIALSGSSSPFISLWVLFTGFAFVVFAILVLRPALALMARRSIEGEPVKEMYICAVLSLVLAAGFATDAIGIHALFGAFIIGIIMPKDGSFASVVIEKVEDLVSSLLLPLYFVSSGLKTNVATIQGGESWGLLVLVICTACLGKIAGTVAVSILFKVPRDEAFALGFLMNTKGLVELIVLNIGKDRKVLNDQTFAILVLMALFTTFITTPIVMTIYKPAARKEGGAYKQRTVQRKDANAELRLLVCFHSTRNIPSMINLVESSRGTRHRGLCVYAMHLMELSERSSAISMVHKARKNGLPFWNKINSGGYNSNGQMVIAFEAYQQLSSVSIRPMTAISAMATIHQDICMSAQRKRAAILLLPFHKHQRVDGSMESIGHAFHQVNQRVLRDAPCSVGILVDRGLGGTTQVSASNVSFQIVVIFWGGGDDREALAYGARMAEHPGIALNVVRFVMESSGAEQVIDEKKKDQECLEEFKVKQHNESMLYEEIVIAGKVDEQAVKNSLNSKSKCNLFLVGRTPTIQIPSLAVLDQTDCLELGQIGSYLASSDFSSTASVLVIQQYNPIQQVMQDVVEDSIDKPNTLPV